MNIVTLLDTGASANFISERQLDHIRQTDTNIQVGICNVTLNLADNTVAVPKGVVTLPVVINASIFNTCFYVMSQLAYPLILGCGFLEHHKAVLQLSRDDRMIELTTFSAHAPNLHLLDTIEIPAYSQRLVECRVDPSIMRHTLYSIEPNDELFHHNGLLIARGITCLNGDNITVAIANITDSSIIVTKQERLASLEVIESTCIASTEEVNDFIMNLHCSNIDDADEHSPITLARQEYIDLLHQQIPKLDVNFTLFSDEEVRRIVDTLTKFADVFDDGTSKYGAAKDVQHVIETGNAKPISQPPQRVSPAERNVIREMTKDMLERGAIQPSVSPWASPVVLVKKKDGKQRFCIDFRKLNQVTVRDVYPIPRIDDCLHALGGNTFFSTFDLFAGYWQITMSELDGHKTAFIVDSGLYVFNVMPFGLTNATATFLRYMDLVLAGLKWSSLLVYLDDICIFAATLTEHLRRMEEMFLRLRKFKLKLNASKCHILRQEFTYLGHVITKEGITADPKKIEAVLKIPPPRNSKQLRSFLGKCNYYRKFIKEFNTQCAPLYDISATRFVWTDEANMAFKNLKLILSKMPMLSYPDFNKPFQVSTNASDDGLGAVLSQIDEEGNERVIQYISRSLQPNEKKCVRENICMRTIPSLPLWSEV